MANTMIISVLERKREIGLRRALGASRAHIRAQFLVESVVLGLLGGTAGTLLGVLTAVGYATLRDWPPAIPLPATVAGLLSSAVVGTLTGLYPAARAARLTSTEALSAP